MFSKELLATLKIVDWGYTEELAPISFNLFNEWVGEKKEGELSYLADERKEKRRNLNQVYKDAQSALVFLFSYHDVFRSVEKMNKENYLKMASYAFAYDGEDYHHHIKKSLKELLVEVKKKYKEVDGQVGIDTWPVLERDLAYRAGLGWFGKNSMLISKEFGSTFFIGSILLNQKIDLDLEQNVETDHCGQCRACIEACPTDAIEEDSRTLIADKCISTYTIELFKDEKTAPIQMENSRGEIFGCDICQTVCPWNERPERFLSPALELKPNKVKTFFLDRPLQAVIEELESWSNKKFVKEFKHTIVERTGRIGLLKNLKFYQK